MRNAISRKNFFDQKTLEAIRFQQYYVMARFAAPQFTLEPSHHRVETRVPSIFFDSKRRLKAKFATI